MARLFVSDVHLDAAAPEATQQFLDFLARQAREAEALYILGDLFEAWVGDDDRDPEKERVCLGLRALTQRGVACFALHGNRDFLLGKGFGEKYALKTAGSHGEPITYRKMGGEIADRLINIFTRDSSGKRAVYGVKMLMSRSAISPPIFR